MTKLKKYEKRKVEIMNLNSDRGKEIDFSELQNRDFFRMFEPDNGEPVKDNKGRTIFRALSDAYVNKDGIYTIDSMGIM